MLLKILIQVLGRILPQIRPTQTLNICIMWFYYEMGRKANSINAKHQCLLINENFFIFVWL